MKKLIFLTAVLFSLTAQAQIKVKVIDATGFEKWIDYIPGVTNVTGVSKSYVDSAVGNKALQSYVYNSLTALQNQYAAKAHRHNASDIDNLPTGSTGTEGQLINLAEQTWYKIIQPNTYGVSYANGTRQGRYFLGGYRTNKGVNFSTDRPDVVFTEAAYNIALPNGSREFTNEGGWDKSVETHYDNSGFVPYGDFESHQFRSYSTDGQEHRHHSIYVNKTNGKARQDLEADEVTFMRTQGQGKNPFTYASLSEAKLNLYAQAPGRVVGLQAYNYDGVVTGLWNIGGEGFIEVPGLISGRSMQGLSIKLPFYADNATAKTALGVGKNYYTRINGIKVLAQVE